MTKKNDFFFREYFPDLEQKQVSSYNISYSKKLPLWIKIFLQWPSINTTIKKERKELNKIIVEKGIDIVISDNRFGLHSKKIKSVFVTHQLNLKTPVFKGFSNWLNRKYIHRFDEVWVPDYEEKVKRLSGELSDSSKINIPVKYIGPKTALEIADAITDKKEEFDYLFLLSGPEPQRTILENIIFGFATKTKKKLAIVRGTSEPGPRNIGNAEVFDFVTGNVLKDLIVNSETVICRSGYSTLMDVHLLNKNKLVLIPTPGQTEQEYLAELWHKKFKARKLEQKKFPEEI
ncbi:MAG: glycosyltransferase [Bacteroidia bacterium]|nr:glycosyltransferase [Bacteroidia bacterium]